MTHSSDSDRGRKLTPTRRALAVAGAATLAFSLVLSIGPVLAAEGTLKIHHAGTGADAGNTPRVCAFYAAFYADDPAEVGSWELIDWDAAGRPVVASGAYDTSGDGNDTTIDLDPAPGHYRFEWTPAGENSKNKMLTVKETCLDEQDAGQSSDPSPSTAESPSGDPSPSSDPSPSTAESPSGDPSPSSDPSPSTVEDPSGDPSPSSDPEGSGDPQPSTVADPSENPVASQDEGGQVEQDVLAGNPTGGSGPMLPDTALPINESGVLAAIGVLLILAAHVGTRRERQLPAA